MEDKKLVIIDAENKETIFIWDSSRSLAENTKEFFGKFELSKFTREDLIHLSEIWDEFTEMLLEN